MDIQSIASVVGAESNGGQLPAVVAQAEQVTLLKKVIETEAASALALLQAVPPATGAQPLATSGKLGTQVNELA